MWRGLLVATTMSSFEGEGAYSANGALSWPLHLRRPRSVNERPMNEETSDQPSQLKLSREFSLSTHASFRSDIGLSSSNGEKHASPSHAIVPRAPLPSSVPPFFFSPLGNGILLLHGNLTAGTGATACALASCCLRHLLFR
jgi:hypothetical protein